MYNAYQTFISANAHRKWLQNPYAHWFKLTITTDIFNYMLQPANRKENADGKLVRSQESFIFNNNKRLQYILSITHI